MINIIINPIKLDLAQHWFFVGNSIEGFREVHDEMVDQGSAITPAQQILGG